MRILLLIVAILLLLVGGIAYMQHGPGIKEVPSASYYESASYLVNDSLKNNLLYNQSELINPSTIYPGITANLTFNDQLVINLSNMSSQSVYVVNTATVQSGTPSWSKEIYQNTTTVTTTKGDKFTFTIPVNISYIFNLTNHIDNQLNVQGTSPTLILNLTVIPRTLPPLHQGMSVVLYSSYYFAEYGNLTTAANTLFTKEPVAGNQVLPLSHTESLFPIAGGIGVAIYMVAPYVPTERDIMAKVKGEHENELIIINRPPSENAILLEKPEYVFRMAEILEVPVFLYEWSRVVYVEHNGNQYSAELK